MKKIVFAVLLLVGSLSAQEGTLVTQTDGPPRDFYTKYFFASGTTIYACSTKASGELTSQSVSAITNASPAVLTIAGHGFNTSAKPQVTVSGGITNWAPINSTFIATVIDGNTLSIALDTTTFGAVTGTILLKTTAARTTRPVWAVQKLDSDVGGNPVAAQWALGGYTNVCANRSILAYQ